MDQTATSVCYFMSKLRDEVGHNASRPKMMSLSECLGAYYRIVTGQATYRDLNVTILRRCIIHVSKNAKSLCLNSFGQHNYKLGMFIFGLIGRSGSMKDIDDILKAVEILFNNKYHTARVIRARDLLETKMYDHPMLAIEKRKEQEDEDEPCKIPSAKKYDSEFVKKFLQAMKDAREEEEGRLGNDLFNPFFVRKFKENLLPIIPLWSSLFLGDLGRHGDGCVPKSLRPMTWIYLDQEGQLRIETYKDAIVDACECGFRDDGINRKDVFCRTSI